MQERYLVHHGILGQKWGIRRYQNEDGTLTPEGKSRFRKVNESTIKQKSDEKSAIRVLSKRTKYHEDIAKYYSKASVKEENKANKYAKGTSEYEKHINKSKEHLEESKKNSKIANLASKKLSDIKSGKLKAGKDFIVQKDWNINLTYIGNYRDINKNLKTNNINTIGDLAAIYPLGIFEYDTTIIDKKRN